MIKFTPCLIVAVAAACLSSLLPQGGSALHATPPAERAFANPLDVKVADPFIMRHDGVYYLYGTSAHPHDANQGIPVFSSTDLVNWRSHGFAFEKAPTDWGDRWFWAGRVYRFGDRWLMYHNAWRVVDGRHFSAICVRESDSPLGPFREIKAPLFEWEVQGAPIDPCVFFDDDGKAYFYFSNVATIDGKIRQSIYGAPLAPDGLSLLAEPKVMISPEQKWELEQPINEGGKMIKHRGTYYLFYAGNNFRNPNYAIGYATASNPLGPWRKYRDNPIVRRNEHSAGVGITTFVPSPDDSELLMLYHSHLNPDGFIRQLNLARVRFKPMSPGPDVVEIEQPSAGRRTIPAGASPRKTAVSDDFSADTIDRSLWTIVDERPENWSLGNSGLQIVTEDGDMWQKRADYRNLFLQLLPDGDFNVSVKVTFKPEENSEQAFLVLWQNADNYLRLSTAYSNGRVLELVQEKAGETRTQKISNTLGDALYLGIARRGNTLTVGVSADGKDWELPFTVDPQMLPEFTLPRIGIGAISPGNKAGRTARFESFQVEVP